MTKRKIVIALGCMLILSEKQVPAAQQKHSVYRPEYVEYLPKLLLKRLDYLILFSPGNRALK